MNEQGIKQDEDPHTHEGIIEQQKNTIEKLLLEKYEPIAIIGIGLQLPGKCQTPSEFSEFLRQGCDGTGSVPEDRWDVEYFYSDDLNERGKIRTSGGGYLESVDQFDPKFFNVSPKEAVYIDPQQRMVLETSWKALEHANIDPTKIREGDGGVYVGVSSMDYTLEVDALLYEEYEGYIGTGTAHSAVSGRVSFFLGWRGPSVSIDTACSSSLVALHQAVQGLRRRECSIALCGGVNAIHHPRNLVIFSQAGMLAPDGKCKTFDESANGYSRSEGCGMLVLKRLSDAQRQGDRIVALIRGSAVRQDGESGGLTVPNGTAQEQVMRAALVDSLLNPDEIQYVEAHGTGTSLGDPIEMGAVNGVFSTARGADDPVIVGSVKTNIGHMEAAAGVGGVIKTALQLQEGAIYPHIHFHTPSKHIPWDDYKVVVPTEYQEWRSDGKRRAIVNSFGFSGTIATVVLEQTVDPGLRQQSASYRSPNVFTLSARSEVSLRTMLGSFKESLENIADNDLPKMCYTTNTGRTHFTHRLASPVTGREELRGWLQRKLDMEDGTLAGESRLRSNRVAFMFTGQGSQYPGMGTGLYSRFRVFRETVDKCDRLFVDYLGTSIRAIMFGKAPDSEQAISQTQYTQPALFTLEFALAQLLWSWGIRPSILIGHSIGEIVAAAVSGLFTLEDAVRVVATRARLMQSVSVPGGMLAVRAGREKVEQLLEGLDNMAFAALNAPTQSVVSGSEESLRQVIEALAKQDIEHVRLPVSHAFHSPLMAEVYDEFRGVFEQVRFRTPKVTLVSNVTGEVASYEQLSNPDYWVRHIGEPVLFAKGIETLGNRGKHLMIELGPSGALMSLARQSVDPAQHLWINCLNPKQDDLACIARAVCDLYQAGQKIDWEGYHQGRFEKADLPTYGFEHKSYWLPVRKRHLPPAGQTRQVHTLLGEPIDSVDSGTHVFVHSVSADSPAYLVDHLVMGQVVYPGAAFIEMLLALQDQIDGENAGLIGDVRILEPLFLTDESIQLRTICTSQGDGTARVSITSRLPVKHGDIERLHVTATLIAPSDDATPLADTAVQLRRLDTELGEANGRKTGDDIYPRFESLGLRYGPAFQRVMSVQRAGERLVRGRLQGLTGDLGELLHPAVLDCAMQTLIGLEDGDHAYLPIHFGRFQFHKKPRGELRSLLGYSESTIKGADLSVDLMVLDGERPVFTLQGLGLKKVAANAGAQREFYHEPRWVKRSLVAIPAPERKRHILVLGACEADFEPYRQVLDDSALNLSFAADIDAGLHLLTSNPDIHALCVFWQVENDQDDLGSLVRTSERNYGALLRMLKGLETSDLSSRELRLWLVTQGGQWLPDDPAPKMSPAALAASTLWGFGQVLLNETPKWRTTLVDLPPPSNEGLELAGLIVEWSASDATSGDFQVAYRADGRHVRRIVAADPTRIEADENFELQITEYGLFDNISAIPVDDMSPERDQIQVEMRAAGLNFKDVLNALGLLKQHAEECGIEYQALPLGFEGAGVVVACGPDAEFEVGDEVILSHLGCMRKRVTLSSGVAVRKPRNIGFDEAAGLATAYITAYYSLHNLAGIKAGDRVLIHAAAGGVGQAAVQIAHAVGAEVYATASPAKWAHLHAQGVRHVMHSRTLDFAGEIERLTGGKGVDIVLNSLNKDFIPTSLRCLGDGGRFVELGKIGIWSAEQMCAKRPDISYHNFDLSEFPEDRLNRLNKEILCQVAALIEKGEVQPLRTTAYRLDEVAEGFGVLSRGANVGKLVLRMSEPRSQVKPVSIDEHHIYLITGGFGALGKVTAEKLAELGARHIALVSRSEPSTQTLNELHRALGGEIKLYPLQADIAVEADVAWLFQTLVSLPVPLGGVFHAAGVLADAPINKQDLDSFRKVFSAKVQGTWLLHAATQSLPEQPLFVGYSSIASVLGPATQSNYAAANAFIDHMMACRVAHGLPGLSVNWGPWGEVGMAARLGEQLTRGIEEKGIRFLSSRDAMRAMLRRLPHAGAQSMICEIDWDRYAAGLNVPDALFKSLASAQETAASELSMEALEHMPATEREQSILDFLRGKIARVLHYETADQIEPDAKFSDLGLDSLVAVELKNALEARFRIPLPTSLVFDYPSIPVLAAHLSAQIRPLEADVDVAEVRTEEAVAEMSDADVDQELTALMESV
ncbi:MAG: type I polyketide synthase [Pseudomonadota bacterium]